MALANPLMLIPVRGSLSLPVVHWLCLVTRAMLVLDWLAHYQDIPVTA